MIDSIDSFKADPADPDPVLYTITHTTTQDSRDVVWREQQTTATLDLFANVKLLRRGRKS